MEENNINISNNKSIQKSILAQDIEMKQNIIKSAIIDKNYDKNIFFNFCMNKKKQGGEDLSNWSTEELTSTINEFIEEQNKISLSNKTLEQEYQKQKELAQNIHLNMNDISYNYNNIQYRQKNNTSQNIFNITEFYCNNLQKSFFNEKEINITIKNPRPMEVGFFCFWLYHI